MFVLIVFFVFADKEFWSKLENILPNEKYHVWGILETGLAQYVSVLEDRARVTEKIMAAEAEVRRLVRSGDRVPCSLQLRTMGSLPSLGGEGGAVL